MKAVLTDFPELVHVAFHGRLDAAWSESASQELEAAIRLGRARIEVDLAQVTFISSVGIGVLLRAVQRFRAVGGVLAVVDASDEVHRMLRVSRLDAMLMGTPAPRQAAERDSSSIDIGDGWSGTATLLHAGRGEARTVTRQMLHAAPGMLALGHLGLAADVVGAAGLFGEGLAVGGTVAVAPADAPRPDCVASEDGGGSRCAAWDAIAVDAPVALRAQFERSGTAPVAISSLAARLANAAGGPVAFVAVGECAGAFGAWARTSPDRWESDAASMDDARLRTAIRFAGEPMHAGESMVVVGVAALPDQRTQVDPAVAATLTDAGPVALHAHAAIAAYRPVPATTTDISAAARLLAEQPLRGVMHALRAADGTETCFVRGVAWAIRIGGAR
jgi:anti-sigma B factor antagonist